MTRYIITAHSTPGAKGRLRTALKLMGMEAIRIEEAEVDATKPKPKPDNVPTSEAAKMCAALYWREVDQEWDEKEIVEIRKLNRRAVMTVENMTLITEHYKRERRKEEHYCRTTLLVFLRHFDGELEKAKEKAHKPKGGRQLEWTPANVVTMPQQDPAEAERIRLATLAQIAERRRAGQ